MIYKEEKARSFFQKVEEKTKTMRKDFNSYLDRFSNTNSGFSKRIMGYDQTNNDLVIINI